MQLEPQRAWAIRVVTPGSGRGCCRAPCRGGLDLWFNDSMVAEINHGLIETPLGLLVIRWQTGKPGGTLLGVGLPPEAAVPRPPEVVAAPAWLEREFQAYFHDPAHQWTIAPRLAGTAFQQRVWRALRAIQPGTVRCYGELAAELDSSARAVGNACRANPCPIIVPCHRVVAKRGLGGFAGQTTGERMRIKAWLLRHEGVKLKEPSA